MRSELRRDDVIARTGCKIGIDVCSSRALDITKEPECGASGVGALASVEVAPLG